MPVEEIQLSLIDDNPFNPRQYYNPQKVADKAESIKQNGLLQKPKARRVNGRVQLAFGGYRKRAFLKLNKEDPKKWTAMPLEIDELNDDQMIVFALEENLKRDDNTPIEVARGIEAYFKHFPEATETALAKKMNMTQGAISNMRRVLTLPAKVLEKIDEGKINFTMARELLIFQGKKGEGNDQRWDRKATRYVDVPKDDEWLMLSAVKGIGGQYGAPATVDGIKKAIYNVCYDAFYHLERITSWDSRRAPLFDTRAAGCLKCEMMVRANETKSQVRHFCTDPKCWLKKQEAHKKKMALAAKKKMEEDIAGRVREAEQHRAVAEAATGQSISQEMVAKMEPDIGIPVLDTAEELERREIEADLGEEIEEFEGEEPEEEEAQPNEADIFQDMKELCRGCINTRKCRDAGRTNIRAADRGGYYCPDRVTKETYQQLQEKAKASVPESLKDKVTEAAGTRAEILDLRELKLGAYGDQLKGGFALLDARVYGPDYRGAEVFDIIDDPDECRERCTKGFHYAYDSGTTDGAIHFVCSVPKCLTQKKAAFTRAKNAAGNARKKAEMDAIKKAVEATTQLDKPRLVLVMLAQCYGHHVSHGYYSDSHPEKELAKSLNVKLVESHQRDSEKENQKLIKKALEQLGQEELAKKVVEFMLKSLTYRGDSIMNYKVQTTEVLNSMGIGINVIKPDTC